MNRSISFSILFAAAALCALAVLISFGQGQNNGLFPLQGESFEQRRTNLLNELSDAVNNARLEGKYHCCIDPPCTMCYLGNWLWNDGTCDCDAMIAKGEFDKVCPQCKKGIGEGRCISTIKEIGECSAPEGVVW